MMPIFSFSLAESFRGVGLWQPASNSPLAVSALVRRKSRRVMLFMFARIGG